MWQPDAIIAGGRRLVVHSDSTLGDLRVLGLMLLEGRGRILWERGDRWRHFRLVFGVEAGSAGGADALARRIWPALKQAQVSGTRLYGAVASHDLGRAASLLADLPRSIAIAGESEERLAEALASPAAVPPKKRRVEWLLLDRESLEVWNAILADLSRDPAAAMAELGWTAPFRMPARLEARRLLRGLLVRTEGAPVPGALQRYLIGRGVRWMQVLDRAELRFHLRLPVGDEDNDGRVHILSERALAGLSRPGWAREVRSYDTRLEILPRDPFAACAQITAIYGDQRRAELDLSPSRPLADAVARIQADLDASGPPTGGPAGV